MPLSQVHYHFGSKGAMVLALLEAENRRGSPARPTMYSQDAPLWRRYEQACDFFEDDLESGYVRVLQEMIAAGWSTPTIAAAARDDPGGWYELLTEVATEAAERSAASVRSSRRGGDAHRQRVHRRPRRCCCSGSTATSCRSGPACAASARSSGPPRKQPRERTRSGRDESARARRRRLRRARRRRAALGGVRRRRADRGAAADVVDHPVPVLEAQVAYLARHHRVVTFDGRGCGRSDRPVGAEAYTDASSPPTRSPCSTRPAPSGPCWSRCRAARSGPSRSPPTTPSACWASWRSGRPCRSHRRARRARASTRSRTDRDDRGLGQVQPPLLAARLDDFLEFFFGQMFTEPHSTKQIEDCVGWGLEIRARRCSPTPTRGLAGVRLRERSARVCERVRCPVLVIHGDEDAHPPARRRRRAGRAHRRLAGHDRRWRPRSARPRPGRRQPAHRATSSTASTRPPTGVAARWVRGRPASEAGAVPVVADRARPRPARRRDRRRAAQATTPTSQIDWLAQHPVTSVLEQPASGCIRRRRWLANESAHIEDEAASTTCTRSRRSAGWTRSSSTTSWSSTTSSRTSTTTS